jgi:ABC-type molybdate transport system substrate-binding protein
MAVTLAALSAGAVRRGVLNVAQMFERASGNRVAFDFTSAPKVRTRILSGEPADIVIASDRVLDALSKESKIVDGVPVALAGLFPEDIQNVTSYQAAVSANAANSASARDFVHSFASADARKMLAAAGLD